MGAIEAWFDEMLLSPANDALSHEINYQPWLTSALAQKPMLDEAFD